MHTEVIDLYEYYGFTAPEGATGKLTCWMYKTSSAVSNSRQRPAVLVIPGGGYSRVSPREAEPVALRFTVCGYAAFILDYSCAPLCFPSALREAALAMRYIREHAAAYEVNPRMVAAVGFSAGGHLCGTLGMCYDAPEVADIGSADLLRPDALGLCYPVAVSWGKTHEGTFENISGGDPELRKALSLEKLVRSDMPPVFLWHTRDDASVPCRNSLILAEALEEKGIDLAFHLYRHGRHGLSTADEMVYPVDKVADTSADVRFWPELMIQFFKETGLCITDEEKIV
ncbi:MAG: alpha/beta hydrolase [Oscillospiraceae bacterium]|nr:alpha/beta hydrolase [Oscillospiraceae bacterium]